MRMLGFLVFFTVVLSVVGGVHYYFWLRLIRDVELSREWRTAVLSCSSCSRSRSRWPSRPGRVLTPPWREILVLPAFLWLGVMFLLFVALVTGDLARLVGFFIASSRGSGGDRRRPSPVRSATVGRRLGVGDVGLTSLRGALGARAAAATPRARGPQRLPRALDGMSIVQITDLHVGPTLGRDYVADVVRRNQRSGRPTSGHHRRSRGRRRRPPAGAHRADGRARARFGVFFVTGQPRVLRRSREWLPEFARMGMRVLRNDE